MRRPKMLLQLQLDSVGRDARAGGSPGGLVVCAGAHDGGIFLVDKQLVQ